MFVKITENKKFDADNEIIKATNSFNYIQNVIMYDICSSFTMFDDIENAPTDFKIKMKDVIDVLGWGDSGNAYNYIVEQVKDLQKKQLILYSNDKSKELSMILFPTTLYNRETKEIEIDFNRKALPFFMNLSKCFCSIEVKKLREIRNEKAQKLYSYLHLWINTKNKVEYSLNELKRIIRIECKEYGNFKRDHLDKIIKEINNIDKDLKLKYNEIKNGRKVVAIEFSYNKKKQEHLIKQQEANRRERIAKSVVEFESGVYKPVFQVRETKTNKTKTKKEDQRLPF